MRNPLVLIHPLCAVESYHSHRPIEEEKIGKHKQLELTNAFAMNELIRDLKPTLKATLFFLFLKTELFCSVFKKICVHTYRFRIVFTCPQYDANQERSHMVASVRHFGYSRSSGLVPGRVYFDDVNVFR